MRPTVRRFGEVGDLRRTRFENTVYGGRDSISYHCWWRAGKGFASPDRGERSHQGLANKILEPEASVGSSDSQLVCRERLGGVLKYHHRRTAWPLSWRFILVKALPAARRSEFSVFSLYCALHPSRLSVASTQFRGAFRNLTPEKAAHRARLNNFTQRVNAVS